MYAYIEGKVVEANPAFVVIETGGIGYDINISVYTFSHLEAGSTTKLFTHLVVREDAQLLFGFSTEQERLLFRNLISVSGVGANTARLILSAYSPDEISTAISSENVDLLKSIKGIGAKSAQRIVIDLKDKLPKDGYISEEKYTLSHNTLYNDALTGLTSLGFNRKQAEKALDKAFTGIQENKPDLELTVEGLIREALKLL
ncbi:MAG: Holliday junction branch migration protein RuvA [Bacteroidales bacterium]|nr:Holliday junction branch migration protein RuvA [Bacteroidales bacterium]